MISRFTELRSKQEQGFVQGKLHRITSLSQRPLFLHRVRYIGRGRVWKPEQD